MYHRFRKTVVGRDKTRRESPCGGGTRVGTLFAAKQTKSVTPCCVEGTKGATVGCGDDGIARVFGGEKGTKSAIKQELNRRIGVNDAGNRGIGGL